MRGSCKYYLPLVGRLVKRSPARVRGEAEPVGGIIGPCHFGGNPHPDACGIDPPHKGEGWS